jgi:hypothetical protein
MMLAYTGYPLLAVAVTMSLFFGWLLWIWLLIVVYLDLVRRTDIGGWGKAGWVVFTIVLPFLGVFVYLIVEGRAMADRRMRRGRGSRTALAR